MKILRSCAAVLLISLFDHSTAVAENVNLDVQVTYLGTSGNEAFFLGPVTGTASSGSYWVDDYHVADKPYVRKDGTVYRWARQMTQIDCAHRKSRMVRYNFFDADGAVLVTSRLMDNAFESQLPGTVGDGELLLVCDGVASQQKHPVMPLRNAAAFALTVIRKSSH